MAQRAAALPCFAPSPVAAAWRVCALGGLLGGLLATAVAAAPHQHGVARADIAVDPGRISLRLDIPLDNLLGFERAPRTDAEREQAQAVVRQLQDAATLLRVDSAAGCSLTRVQLVAPELGLSPPAETAAATASASGHADLTADYDYSCRDSAKARAVTLGLFDAFPRLRRIEVQTATPRGQLKAVLQRPNSRVTLAR